MISGRPTVTREMPAMTPTNLLMDAVESLQSCADDEARWKVISDLATRAGANAVNVAGFLGAEPLPLWARSSMTTDWLDEYMGEAFFNIDPLLNERAQGLMPAPRDIAPLFRTSDRGTANWRLNGALLEYDYRHFTTFSLPNDRGRGSRMVVFASDQPGSSFHGQKIAPILPALAQLIGQYTPQPEGMDDLGALMVSFTPLSTREKDALLFLASGCRNDMIAHKMGVAEITVRQHLQTARKKLGARTREQALVKAMTLGYLSP